jgi:hypothetical protein
MTTREMKVLRRGMIVLGILFLLASFMNTHCDNGFNRGGLHGR